MRFLKIILLCLLLITVGCTEREEISDLQVKFENTTGFDIENLKISDKTIGTQTQIKAQHILILKNLDLTLDYQMKVALD